jgi:hypothetical protein
MMIRLDKKEQQTLGFILTVLEIGVTIYLWHEVIVRCSYPVKVMFFAPALAVIGIGLIFFPIDHAYLEKKYQVERISFSQYPVVWRYLLLLSLFVGLANSIILSNIGSLTELKC